MMLDELKLGHQVYVIAPLIEESENSDLTTVCKLKDQMKLAFGEHYKDCAIKAWNRRTNE